MIFSSHINNSRIKSNIKTSQKKELINYLVIRHYDGVDIKIENESGDILFTQNFKIFDECEKNDKLFLEI